MSKRQKYSLLNIFLTLVLVGLIGIGVTKGDRSEADIIGAGISIDDVHLGFTDGVITTELEGSWYRSAMPTPNFEKRIILDFENTPFEIPSLFYTIPEEGPGGVYEFDWEVMCDVITPHKSTNPFPQPDLLLGHVMPWESGWTADDLDSEYGAGNWRYIDGDPNHVLVEFYSIDNPFWDPTSYCPDPSPAVSPGWLPSPWPPTPSPYPSSWPPTPAP